ncbi:DUF4129 domain-containing protein [Luteimicrobium album]|uniref:DUF4129 domain-containing protein n=1 Tax=Luteimicrobium album TaxID=1054550 RepID=UPI0024E0907A|nr:DUF4129 domain-containing protein [Luteimicrobium album]
MILAGLLVRASGVRLDAPPVTPDGPTAQRWAVDELSRPEYHQHESLLARFLRWLGDLFDGAPTLGLPPGWAAVVVVGVVLLVVGVALLVAGPVRRTRRVHAPRPVFDDAARSAAELRTLADDAAAAGDWDVAVVERFRALVRSLEERVVLAEVPGRTADEAAREASAAFGAGPAARLAASARTFDDVRYGGRHAGPGDDAALRALDDELRTSTPHRTDAPAGVGA